MEQASRIELPSSAWEAEVLPLNDACVELATGVEPATYWLQISSSTIWATPASILKRVRWVVSTSRIPGGVTQPCFARLAPRRSWSSVCSTDGAGIVFTWLLLLVYELFGASSGNWTHVISLEGWGNSHYTTPASLTVYILYHEFWKSSNFLSCLLTFLASWFEVVAPE